MQYMISVMADEVGAAGGDRAAIDAFDDQLRAEGLWVFGGALKPPATATVVDGRDAETMIIDGPFVETKEYLMGFWVIDAPDFDAVLKIIPEASKACNAKIEIRPFEGE